MKKTYVGRDDDIVEEGFFRSYEVKKKKELKVSNRIGVMDDSKTVEDLKELNRRNDILDEEAKTVEATYVEPANYFPEETRKKFKLGEYAEE